MRLILPFPVDDVRKILKTLGGWPLTVVKGDDNFAAHSEHAVVRFDI